MDKETALAEAVWQIANFLIWDTIETAPDLLSQLQQASWWTEMDTDLQEHVAAALKNE